MNAATRRRNPFRPILFVLGGIAVLTLALYIVLVSALDPAKLRDELRDAVLRSTGRTLTATGGVHLRFGLSPEFEVDDITLSNIPGGSRPQMLVAKSARADLALLPLLGGDAVISALTIDQPDIVLERNADGTPNWQFSPEHHTLYAGHSGGGGGGRHHAEIHKIALSGGKITWIPRQGPARIVNIDNLAVSSANDDAPIFLSVAGSYAGPDGPVPFTLSGTSGSYQRLQGGQVNALAGAWPLMLQLTLPTADLHLEGGINHPEQERSYQFRLTGHATDLSQLNFLLPQPYLLPLSGINFTALLSDDSAGQLRTSQLSMRAENSDLGRLVPGLAIKQAVLSAPGPGQLVQLSVDGTYADQPLRIAAAVMQPDILASTAPVSLTLTAQAAGATIDAHGMLPPSLGASGLDIQVEAKAPDLSSLSPLVQHTLPPAHDFSLTADVQDAGLKLRGITIHNLVAGSSLGDVAGDLTLSWSPRFALSGTLASHTLDVDSILSGTPGQLMPVVWPPPANSTAPVQMQPPTEIVQTTPPAAPLSPGAAPLVLPLAFLRTHDATITLTIGDLLAWGQHYRDLAAHLELVDGRLALNPFRAQAPEGAIIGGASIDATSDQPPVAVTLRSPSIAAGAIANLLGYPQGALGTMQVDAALSGIGPTLATFQSGLNGRLGLAMVNGEISNAMIGGLIGDALQTAGVPSLGDGTSQVRCLALRMDFADGLGTVKALAADTSRLSLSGDGTVNLNAGTLDLHLRPQVRLGPTEVSSPVSVTGPFGALKATLDPVFNNGRVGIQIGGAPTNSGCVDKLAIARNGLGGPMPPAAPASDPGLTFKIKKPKDLLQGLFH